VQVYGPVGHTRRFFQTLQNAATRLARAAAKNLLAVLSYHFFSRHAEQGLGGSVGANNAKTFVIDE
jgi:hypothetical protein